MTLDQFRYFLETAKFQHVGKAAKSLHISPSAVSAAISALEKELGSRFFERKGQGIQLTEKGQLLRGRVERILDQVGQLHGSMGGEAEIISGNYRLAASHFLSLHFLGQAWSAIQNRHPLVSAELNSLPTAQVIAEILSGGLDAGLCFSPLRHPELKHLQIGEGQMQIVVRKGHPLLKKPVKAPFTQLSRFPAVIHKALPGVEICEDHPMFEKFGIRPRTHCLWDNDDLAIEVIKRTDSWSLVPDLVGRLHRGAIGTLTPPAGWDAPYSIAFVIRSHRAENPFLRLLGEELAKGIGKDAFAAKTPSKGRSPGRR